LELAWQLCRGQVKFAPPKIMELIWQLCRGQARFVPFTQPWPAGSSCAGGSAPAAGRTVTIKSRILNVDIIHLTATRYVIRTLSDHS
jgi:hypothetical protein